MKESVYDEKISPLMSQIIAICQEHKINMFATFALDVDPETDNILKCTTALAIDESEAEGLVLVKRLLDVARPRTYYAAMTIMSGPKK